MEINAGGERNARYIYFMVIHCVCLSNHQMIITYSINLFPFQQCFNSKFTNIQVKMKLYLVICLVIPCILDIKVGKVYIQTFLGYQVSLRLLEQYSRSLSQNKSKRRAQAIAQWQCAYKLCLRLCLQSWVTLNMQIPEIMIQPTKCVK